MAVYTINLHAADDSETKKEQNIIYDSATQYKNYLKIPKSHRFTNLDREHKKFTPIAPGVLANVKLSDKLMIFAHGEEHSLGPYKNTVGDPNAQALADDLEKWGLKECGGITFKACHIGKGYFMEFFAQKLAKKGIPFGWIKGYVGKAATWKTFGILGPPTEFITSVSVPGAAEDKNPDTKKTYRAVVYKGPKFDDAKVPVLKTQGAFMVEADSDDA